MGTFTVLVSYLQTSEAVCSVSDVSCYSPCGNYYQMTPTFTLHALNFSFCNHLGFTGKLQRQYREFPSPLHPAPLTLLC